MFILSLLVVVLASLCTYSVVQRAILSINRRRFIREHNCIPVRRIPSKDPVLGSDVVFQSYKHLNTHSYLDLTRKRFLEHGNTFQAKMMGARVYNTAEPENIKTLLASRFDDFGLGKRRKSAFKSLIGHAILNTDGTEWSHSRRFLRPSFARDQWGDLAVLEKHVLNLVAQIPRNESSVDLQELFFRMTMDTSTEIFFGESAYSLISSGNAEPRMLADAFNRAERTIAMDYVLGPFAVLSSHGTFSKDCKLLHGFVDNIVQKALALRGTENAMGEADKPCSEQGNERYVVLYELVKKTRNSLQLRSEVLGLLMAGRDSTACLLSGLWFTLSRRQDIWTRLQEEIAGLKGAKPDLGGLKEMKYLQACLNEGIWTLRALNHTV